MTVDLVLTFISELPLKLVCGDTVFASESPPLFWITDHKGVPYKLHKDGRTCGRYAVQKLDSEMTEKVIRKIPMATPHLKLQKIGENPIATWWKVC
jgi:hypothetical protein